MEAAPCAQYRYIILLQVAAVLSTHDTGGRGGSEGLLTSGEIGTQSCLSPKPGDPRCSRTPCSRCFWIFPELYADTRWAFSTMQMPSTGQRPCTPGRKRGAGFCHPVWSPLCCHERRDRLWPGRPLCVKPVGCELTVRVAAAFACGGEGQGEGRRKKRGRS